MRQIHVTGLTLPLELALAGNPNAMHRRKHTPDQNPKASDICGRTQSKKAKYRSYRFTFPQPLS